MQGELLKYFDRHMLTIGWNYCDDIDYLLETKDGQPHYKVIFDCRSQKIIDMADEMKLDERTFYNLLVNIKGLGEFMKQGPVIIRPDPELCEAMRATEIRLSLSEYKQKFPVVAIDMPREFPGFQDPGLLFVWTIAPRGFLIWHYSKNGKSVFVDLFSDQSKTIEQQILQRFNGTNDPGLNEWMRGSIRMAINLALLMTHRPSDLTPLPPKIAKNRNCNDDRLRQLAAREAQTVIFRDLVIKPKPKYIECQETGQKLRPHLRSGHWKNQACGPKWQDHKTLWVEPYWTGQKDEEEVTEDVMKPTIIYR